MGRRKSSVTAFRVECVSGAVIDESAFHNSHRLCNEREQEEAKSQMKQDIKPGRRFYVRNTSLHLPRLILLVESKRLMLLWAWQISQTEEKRLENSKSFAATYCPLNALSTRKILFSIYLRRLVGSGSGKKNRNEKLKHFERLRQKITQQHWTVSPAASMFCVITSSRHDVRRSCEKIDDLISSRRH